LENIAQCFKTVTQKCQNFYKKTQFETLEYLKNPCFDFLI